MLQLLRQPRSYGWGLPQLYKLGWNRALHTTDPPFQGAPKAVPVELKKLKDSFNDATSGACVLLCVCICCRGGVQLETLACRALCSLSCMPVR